MLVGAHGLVGLHFSMEWSGLVCKLDMTMITRELCFSILVCNESYQVIASLLTMQNSEEH